MTYSLRGKAYWAKVYPENASEGKLSMDLGLLTDQDIKMARDLGLKVKQDEMRGPHISLWNYATNFDGTPKTLRIVDAGLNPLKSLIGNGSDVYVEFRVKDWEYKGKTGKRAELGAVQVEKLVAFDKPPAGSTFKKLDKETADAIYAPFDADEEVA
jgi:hypothetical protein